MNDGDHKSLGKLDKLAKCERCGDRLPTDSEIGALCNRRKLESREYIQRSMEPLERKGLAFCVCPERLWQRKPHLVAAVLAAKYSNMNWESPTGKNRTASWIIDQLAGNSKNEALTAKERRRLYEFREKGNEILYLWGLEFGELAIPLIVFLDNLMSNPLFEMGAQKPHTPAEMDKFIRDVAQDRSLLLTLLMAEVTGHVFWPDENPFGYDPDGMKEELYKEHPEYRPILEGVMDDHGYDECLAVMASYGFSPHLDECEISYEEATAEMEWATSPEYQASPEGMTDDYDYDECLERALKLQDKLRARMIAALKQMVTSLTSKTPK